MAKVSISSKRRKRATRAELVQQFLIVLAGTEPLVWRRIQVPEEQVIANRRHPEHASMLEWVGGAYDPDAFDPAAVVFEDPKKRWKRAFERQEGI